MGTPGGKGRHLGCSQPRHHLLEPQEEDLQPQPGKEQQDDHGGEGKAEPGGKVHRVGIFGEEPEGGCGLLSDVTQLPPSRTGSPWRVQSPPATRGHSRIDLALQHQVGCGARQRGDAPDAGRVAHTQAHALVKAELLLVLRCPRL